MTQKNDQISASPDQSFRLDDIVRRIKGQKYPPVHLWNPPFCGDIDMRIARDGTWFYMGTPIGRKEMVKLFASILRRDDDGRTYLVTPVEKVGIQVEDAPLVAVELMRSGQGQGETLSFRTNVDDLVMAGPDHAIRVEIDAQTGEPAPYIHVRANLEALINRPVFYELAALAVEKDGQHGVWSGGEFYSLGQVGR